MIRNLLFIFLFCTGNVFADYQNNEVKDFIDYMYKEYSYDKNTLDVIKEYNCYYVLMHSIKTPINMQEIQKMKMQ